MTKLIEDKNIVTIDGVTYDRRNEGTSIRNCFITNEPLHIRHKGLSVVYNDIKIHRRRLSGIPFDRHNEVSYTQYRVFEAYSRHSTLEYFYTINPDLNLRISVYNYGHLYIATTSNEQKSAIISSLGLVPGVNNPDTYYDPHEIAYMDRPRPYRKFDNTRSKIYTKDILKGLKPSEYSSSAEAREISKAVLAKNIENGVESLTFRETEGYRYTFGIELETCLGTLSEEDVLGLNVKAVHDGSLREAGGESPLGGEYVTGVLTGDAGLLQVYNICRVLSKRCKLDRRCGTHVHIGSLNWSKEQIVLSYFLALAIEAEMFMTLPPSRRGGDYSRPLKPLFSAVDKKLLAIASSNEERRVIIDEYYNRIFKYVIGGPYDNTKEFSRDMNHPKGSKCNFDKTSQRYCWLNYVTLLFNTKGSKDSHTLEFRPMSGTLNFTKVKNWLKFCIAFCAFVENHSSIIINSPTISLDTMIMKTFPKTGDKLIQYNRERTQLFKSADESVDHEVDRGINKKSMKEVACAL